MPYQVMSPIYRHGHNINLIQYKKHFSPPILLPCLYRGVLGERTLLFFHNFLIIYFLYPCTWFFVYVFFCHSCSLVDFIWPPFLCSISASVLTHFSPIMSVVPCTLQPLIPLVNLSQSGMYCLSILDIFFIAVFNVTPFYSFLSVRSVYPTITSGFQLTPSLYSIGVQFTLFQARKGVIIPEN